LYNINENKEQILFEFRFILNLRYSLKNKKNNLNGKLNDSYGKEEDELNPNFEPSEEMIDNESQIVKHEELKLWVLYTFFLN
jgi:hypothetical protein